MTLKDTSFVDLMLRRVCNVLLLANPYDAFMLEDDGRVDEKIFSEYARLGLRFPPRFIQVANQEEAELQMRGGNIDLVICMPAAESNDVFDIARSIKEDNPHIPYSRSMICLRKILKRPNHFQKNGLVSRENFMILISLKNWQLPRDELHFPKV